MTPATYQAVVGFVKIAVPEEERAEVLALLNPAMEQEEFLTTKEAATYLGVSIRTLQVYENEGKIRARRLSRQKVRWNKAELKALRNGGVA